MKLISTILLMFCGKAHATNYYVSNTGSDAANGLTIGAAWQTIAKVNSFSFTPGDSILFKRGDSWSETLRVPSSGNSSNRIYINAYGTGNLPVFTGFQTVTGFSDSSHVWSKTLTITDSLKVVSVSDSIRAKGRYPNYSYLSYTSRTAGSYSYLIGTATGVPGYTDGEIAIRTAHWLLDIRKITSQPGDSIYFSPAADFHNGARGYFIQNSVKALDTLNEWCYNYTTKKLYVYSVSTPNVQVSFIDTLLSIKNKQYVTVENIKFTGANFVAVNSDTSDNITVNNCYFLDNSSAIYAKKSTRFIAAYDTVVNALNAGIHLKEQNFDSLDKNVCDTAYVHHNYIKKVGYLAGMGASGEETYTAIRTIGNGSEISYNVIDSVGYIPINYNGYNTIIRRNTIRNFCYVKDDGGGIYSIISYLPVKTTGSKIVSNIIYNGLTAIPGTGGGLSTQGVYMDNGSIYVTIDSNTFFNVANAALYLHISKNITFRYNTIYNCPERSIQYTGLETLSQTNLITHNYIYSDTSTKGLIYGGYLSGGLFGVQDSNYYSHINYETKIVTNDGIDYSLPAWVTFSGADVHSTGAPSGITSANAIFKYNPSNSSVVYPLSGTYVSINGIEYTGSITLQPFTSAILFKSIYNRLTIRGTRYKRVVSP